MLFPYQLNDHTQLCSYSYVAVVMSSIAAIRVSDNFLRNEIHQKFKSSLKSGNACYHSVQDLYNNFAVVMYGCET